MYHADIMGRTQQLLLSGQIFDLSRLLNFGPDGPAVNFAANLRPSPQYCLGSLRGNSSSPHFPSKSRYERGCEAVEEARLNAVKASVSGA